jgi:HEAT repeat protein
VKTFSVRFLSIVVCAALLCIPQYAIAEVDLSNTISTAQDMSMSVNERILAIRALGASEDARASGPLLDILGNLAETGAIRSNAVRALANLGTPRAEILQALEKVYRDPLTGNNLSYTVLLYLGYMQATESLPLLSEALSHSNSMIRFKAAQALGMLQSDDAIDALVSHMENEEDPMVRAEMVQAIGQTQNPATEAALIQALRSDQEPLVRYNAAIMLGKFETLSPEARSALEAARDDASPSVRAKVKGMLP